MDYDYLLRIFLLGDLGCGKSSFVGALLNEKAVHKKIDFKFTYFNVGDKKAKQNIRFCFSSSLRMAQMAHGFILLYAINDEQSFNNISMWLDYADKSESIDSRLVLVGTKSDLEEERMISHQQGKYLADKYKIPFFEVHGGSNAKCHEVVQTLVQDVITNSPNERIIPKQLLVFDKKQRKYNQCC